MDKIWVSLSVCNNNLFVLFQYLFFTKHSRIVCNVLQIFKGEKVLIMVWWIRYAPCYAINNWFCNSWQGGRCKCCRGRTVSLPWGLPFICKMKTPAFEINTLTGLAEKQGHRVITDQLGGNHKLPATPYKPSCFTAGTTDSFLEQSP